MKKISGSSLRLGAALLFATAAFTGCESTNGGGAQTNVYYGVGFTDPWYYGHYDYDHDYDVIVTPPNRPGNRPDWGARPSHPIARPPGGNIGSRPSQMPSIPSAPRVSARGGGRR
jgi:hypothetical protein